MWAVIVTICYNVGMCLSIYGGAVYETATACQIGIGQRIAEVRADLEHTEQAGTIMGRCFKMTE